MSSLTPAFLCLLSVSLAFSAEPKWIHVDSSDFEIFSSASEGDTRRVLQHFERVGSFFEQALGPGLKQKSEPVRIIVFGSKKDFDQYRPNEFATAFYTQIGGRDYIVLSGASDDVFPTAVHEYVHLVVQHEGYALPPWLNEGLAELYSTLKPLGDKILIGTIIPGRVQEISQQKWVPLATILAATHDSPYYNEKDKAGALYNEGWALTHMLELSNEYGLKFSPAFQQIAKGTPSQTALENTYGKPLSAIEKDLQAYLHKDSLVGRLVPAKMQDGPRGTVEPAQPFDVKLTLLDLSNKKGKEAGTRQKLNDLASEYPKRPEPQSALGYLEWRAGRQEDAARAFTKAFDLGGRNPQMLWDYGRLAGNSGDSADAVRALNALLELQPGRMDARLVLAGIELNIHRAKEALETLAPVKSVKAADAPRFFEMLAYAKLQTGDSAGARTNGLMWIQNTTDPGQHERATRFVQALDGQSKASAASVSSAPPSEDPDSGRPHLARASAVPETGKSPTPVEAPLPSIQGNFTELDCSGPAPGLVIQTGTDKIVLLMKDPSKVDITGVGAATVDLNCGPQKPSPVSVKYEPADSAQKGVKGFVRAIRFEADSPKK